MNIYGTEVLNTQLNRSIWHPAKIAKRAKKQENKNHNRGKKQSIKANPETVQVREFSDEHVGTVGCPMPSW